MKLQKQRVGGKTDLLIKKSFFISKYLTLNSFTIPICKRIRLTFPLFESESLIKSKSIMILLEFLEQVSGLRPILKKANLILGSGLWVRGEIDIAGFNLTKFFVFFNEFFLSHPLLRYSSKLPFLKKISKNNIKLFILEIDFFFDASTRRFLPYNNNYWLECDFFFDNKFKLQNEGVIFFYTQYFFSHNILEWRNH